MKQRRRSRYSRVPTHHSSDSSSSEDEESVVDESVIGQRTNYKKMTIISSDESEEELEVERRALSPTTRRSIGFPLQHTSEDEEEDDGFIETEIEQETITNEETAVTMQNDGPRKSNFAAEVDFERSIKLKMSSTLSPHVETGNESVEAIGKSEEIFEISDSTVEELNENNTPVAIQPQQVSTPVLEVKESKQTKLVSRSYYEEQLRALEASKNQKERLEQLRVARHLLPDKGVKLDVQLANLEEVIPMQINILSGLKIDENLKVKTSLLSNESNGSESSIEFINSPPKSLPPKEIQVENGAHGINWDVIKEANAQVQPKFTGKQGLKTFNNEKANTEKCLNQIHSSLETQPDETVHAPTPEAIKIELMDHQKHALAW